LKFEYYHVIGLQRTGTNWLHSLVKKNFKVKRKQNFWKHLSPIGQNENYHNVHGPAGSDLTLDPNVFYIVTNKDFGKWIESIKKRRVDFWTSHNFPDKENKTFEDVYYPWQEWKNSNLNKENFFYRDYEDWNSNWKKHFETIAKLTGWEKLQEDFVSEERRF
jgi:hypothetical protein